MPWSLSSCKGINVSLFPNGRYLCFDYIPPYRSLGIYSFHGTGNLLDLAGDETVWAGFL